MMDPKITPSGQTIVKPTALDPVANTDSKLLIYGLFQKGRVLAQDAVPIFGHDSVRLQRFDPSPNPDFPTVTDGLDGPASCSVNSHPHDAVFSLAWAHRTLQSRYGPPPRVNDEHPSLTVGTCFAAQLHRVHDLTRLALWTSRNRYL